MRSHAAEAPVPATNGAHAAPFVRLRVARLRDNPGMWRARNFLLIACACLLVACDAGAPVAGAATSGPPSSALEFRGERPCVDCVAIESWLRLEQEGGARRFRMIEDYRGEGRDRRFEDAGEWLAEGDLLRLRSQDGGERVYARIGDGMLQARDARGRSMPATADEVLVPTTFDTAR
jgi:hypothetical protein